MSEKPNNQVPNYVKVQNYILEKCRSGEYAVGSRIPSETELARMFSVSRITANKAVSELALMGVLKRIRGKGSFVISTEPVRTSQAFSAAVITKVSEGKKHELSQFRVLTSCPELAQKLGLPAGESFMRWCEKTSTPGVLSLGTIPTFPAPWPPICPSPLNRFETVISMTTCAFFPMSTPSL